MKYDWQQVAARLRGLVQIHDELDIPAVAERLGVSEASLRMSVSGRRSMPTVDVVAAVVRVYGLDPSWVLTGEYNPDTHREALESDTDEIETTLNEMISSRRPSGERELR